MSKTKLEMKVSNLEECIKEKDDRISRLEIINKERKENRANWINFCAFFYLISTLLVAGLLYYIYYPENIQFRDTIALSGMVVIVFNGVLTGFVLIFDTLCNKEFDLEFAYVVGNIFVIPSSIVLSAVAVAVGGIIA